MTRTYAVLVRNMDRFDLNEAARLTAEVLGEPHADAAARLSRSGGALHASLDEPRTRALVQRFERTAMGAGAIPVEQLIQVAEPVTLLKARQDGEDGLVLEGAVRTGPGKVRGTFPIRGGEIQVLVAGWVREATVERRVESQRDFVLTGQGPAVVQTVGTVKRDQIKAQAFADLLVGVPPFHVRIDVSGFPFRAFRACTGHSASENLAMLLTWLRGIAPAAMVDVSVDKMLDGNPATNLTFASTGAYDHYVYWTAQKAHQMRKAGGG